MMSPLDWLATEVLNAFRTLHNSFHHRETCQTTKFRKPNHSIQECDHVATNFYTAAHDGNTMPYSVKNKTSVPCIAIDHDVVNILVIQKDS